MIGYVILRSRWAAYPDVLVAPRPVREIVQDALAAELRKNDHALVTGEADRSLAVDVREFWVSSEEGFWCFRFPGTALIDMTVTDGQTGQTMLTRDYQGRAIEHGQLNAKWNWKAAMNAARDVSRPLGGDRAGGLVREVDARALPQANGLFEKVPRDLQERAVRPGDGSEGLLGRSGLDRDLVLDPFISRTRWRPGGRASSCCRFL